MTQIIRRAMSYESAFTQIPVAFLRDERLSRKARGFLAEMLSHREGWVLSAQSLQDAGSEGREAVRAALRELEEFGYLRRTQERVAGSRFGEMTLELTNPHEAFHVDNPSADVFSGDGKPEMAGDSYCSYIEKEYTGPIARQAAGPIPDDAPTYESSSTRKHRAKTPSRTRGGRIPADWTPPEHLRETWLADNAPSVDWKTESESFRDYWLGVSGSKGVKADWDATWRNWCRKTHKYAVEHGWKPRGSNGWGGDFTIYR